MTAKSPGSLAAALYADEFALQGGGTPMNDSSKPNANAFEDTLNQQGPALRNDGVPSAGDWRELARRVQHETDPDKLSALVQQLIAAFDREKSQKHSFPPSEKQETTPGLG
jgi:hypothetical protein